MCRLLRRLALFAPLTVALPAVAQQPPDLIEHSRREQAIAVQQVEAEVRASMQEAAKLTDKAEAVKHYQGLAQRVQNDKNLPEDRRAALKHVLNERMKLAEVEANTPDTAKNRVQFAERSAAKSDAGKYASTLADTTKIKEGITKVESFSLQGKTGDAQKAAKELLAKYPDSVAVQVLNGISTSAEDLAAAQAVRLESDRRRLLAMRDVDRSVMAPVRDYEFPSNWKEISERRLKAYGISAEDRAVLESLAAPIKIEFKGTRLQDVIECLSNQMKRTIILDKNALDEGQLTYDTPVTCSFKTPVATRTALRVMLNGLNLTFVVRDGIIQVTNAARAKDVMVTRPYYIGDLVTGLGMFNSAPQLGQAQDQAQLAANVQVIIEMITQSVDPSSWMGKGGLGVIGYNIQTQSLIIRQSAEVHNMIRGSLNR